MKNYQDWINSLKINNKVYVTNETGGKLTTITSISPDKIETEIGTFNSNGEDDNGRKLRKGIYLNEEQTKLFKSCFIDDAKRIIKNRKVE